MNPSPMNLEQLQRTVFDVVRQPLTEDERMREHTLDGRSTKAIAEEIVKPNDRLTSVERLEIYNRVYWFRLLTKSTKKRSRQSNTFRPVRRWHHEPRDHESGPAPARRL